MAKRITEAEKERMRELRAEGLSYQAVSDKIGCCRSTVRNCLVPGSREKSRESTLKWWAEHSNYMKAYMKTYCQTAEYRARCKTYRQTLAYNEYLKTYRQTPGYKEKERVRNQTQKRKAARNAYRRTIKGRLEANLRARLYVAIKNNYKAGSAVSDLGCTVEELRAYLGRLFSPGMTWWNWGVYGWHIDHVKPLASFDLTDREQFKEACHYTNLQPLWAEDNLSKGSKILPAA